MMAVITRHGNNLTAMGNKKTIQLNHTFCVDKHRSYKLDTSRVKSVEDVVLILGALNIQLCVPCNISDSQFAAIEKFLVEA